MPYNPDAMTIIVSGDLAPEMMEKLKGQLTADVITSEEFREREKALALQEEAEEQTHENRVEAGLEEEDPSGGFSAPSEGEVADVDVTDTSDPNAGEEGTDGEADPLADETPTEGEGEGEPDPEANNEEDPLADGETTVDPEDEKELSDEDKEVKDELDEPNAAFEHAQGAGSKELGQYLRLGTSKYKRRVRRLRLAQETLQMDAAQRQKLMRRLFYVKPADTGFTSKMQTFLSTINNPDDWVALIDEEGMMSAEHDLTKKQIEAALERAGVTMFNNVETMADTFNQVQKAITEPATNQDTDSYDAF